MPKPLVLHGGVDVNPELYGETPSRFTQHPNRPRDYTEVALYKEAVANKIPVVGVCRGAQLICVLNGGKLHQHTEPKEQSHSIATLDGHIFERVMAGHHQIMRPSGNYIMYGWNPGVTAVWKDDVDFEYKHDCPEVVYFPDTNSLAIQPHPEWASKTDPFVIWINGLMEELKINLKFPL